MSLSAASDLGLHCLPMSHKTGCFIDITKIESGKKISVQTLT